MGIKNFYRLVVENVFAFLEKLGVKETPAFSLEMTKIHVSLIATLSNMIKTVRKLKKIEQEETNCQENNKKESKLKMFYMKWLSLSTHSKA